MSMRFNMSQHGTPSENPAKGLRLTGKGIKKNEWVVKEKKKDK